MKQKKFRDTATYTGRRLLANGKVYQRFEGSDGRERYFRGIRGVSIGFTYRCAKAKMPIRPEMTDDERINNPEWEAADALVDERNAKRRADAKVQSMSKPALKAAMEALKPLIKGMSYYERAALVNHLIMTMKY